MLTATKTPEVVTKATMQAVKILNALGLDFKIIDRDGTEYGNLEVAPKKKRNMNPNREYGDLVKHYDQYIDYDAAIGDVFEIPRGEFEVDEIRSGVCSKLSKEWGNGTYTTAIADDRVQVLRIA
jgi:hypothetical protein